MAESRGEQLLKAATIYSLFEELANKPKPAAASNHRNRPHWELPWG